GHDSPAHQAGGSRSRVRPRPGAARGDGGGGRDARRMWCRGMIQDRYRVATQLPAAMVALMVTRRCNMTCGHCSVESGPDIRREPTERELLDHGRRAAAAEVRSINLTGGEPMLRPRVVLRLVRAARRLGVATSLTTNGSWGRTAARASRGVRMLRRAGL